MTRKIEPTIPVSRDSRTGAPALRAGATTIDLAKRLGDLYTAFSNWQRIQLLESLLAQTRLLTLVTLADGAFADIGLRGRWPDFKVNETDVQLIQEAEIAELAEHVILQEPDAFSSKVLPRLRELALDNSAARVPEAITDINDLESKLLRESGRYAVH